ncbi:MAG: hypothetical protein ACYCO3_01495, partial [Mycobacteriales bacterium]
PPPAPAFASGTHGTLPSVSVRPYVLDRSGPDRGAWFVFDLRPGQSATERALIVNVSTVPELVSIFARDLTFTAAGAPELVTGKQSDVGAWITVATTRAVVPPRRGIVVPFSVKVPLTATPGDHIGALVVASAPQHLAGYNLVEQVATRIYVTVPGHVRPAMALGQVTEKLNSPIWPSAVTATVVLHNTGRIRVSPVVEVNGHRAAGSSVLLARSAEVYQASLPLHWWGGHVSIRISAAAKGLRTQTRSVSLWVVNWVLVAAVLIGLLLLSLGGYEALRRHRRHKALDLELTDMRSRLASLDRTRTG